MRRRITRGGYRTLAIVWTLAAASVAVAFVRRVAEFNLMLLLLLALSVLTAANFWRTYRRTEEGAPPDPFQGPPTFSGDPVLFEDDPPAAGCLNKDSEENDNER